MKPACRLVLLVVSFGLLAELFGGDHLARADAAFDDEARRDFQRGEKLYKEQKYFEAAASFQEGYKHLPHPAFLFDLALTYQALHDGPRAIEYYQAYLKAQPQAADRPAVEAAIAEVKRKLAQDKPAPPPVVAPPPKLAAAPAPVVAPPPKLAATPAPVVAPPTPPPPAPAPVVVAPPTAPPEPAASAAPAVDSLTMAGKEPNAPMAKTEARPFYKKWWFWTATGVAVSAVAVGLGVGLSQSASSEPFREVTWR